MSLYIYAPVLTQGAKELIQTLNAKRLIKHDGMHFLRKGTPVEFGPSDAIVCWGAHVPPVGKIPCLNTTYKYANMLQVNTMGLAHLRNQRVNAFEMIPLGAAQYASSLVTNKPADQWWPIKTTNGYVSAPEFDGYGVQFHRFAETAKYMVFRGQVFGPKGPYTPHAQKALEVLGLDFGVVYLGIINNDSFVLKVITGPALSTAEVTTFAKHISAWADMAMIQQLILPE